MEPSGQNPEKTIFFYDEKKRIGSRLLETPEYGVLLEQRHYDDAGRLVRIDLSQSTGEKETPFLRIEYDFYKQSNLESFL